MQSRIDREWGIDGIWTTPAKKQQADPRRSISRAASHDQGAHAVGSLAPGQGDGGDPGGRDFHASILSSSFLQLAVRALTDKAGGQCYPLVPADEGMVAAKVVKIGRGDLDGIVEQRNSHQRGLWGDKPPISGVCV